MPVKLDDCWRLRRSMTVRRAPRQRRSAASGFRSSGTGCCGSTRAARTVCSTANRQASPRGSMIPSARPLRGDRERSDPGGPWRGALAADRSGAMDLRGVPHHASPSRRLSRELRAMGYRKLSARPRHHAQAEGVIEDFKKVSPPPGRNRAREGLDSNDRNLVRRRGSHRPEEQDHPPVGQARHPPSAPRDQRTASTYIFGAVCPKQGKGAALILPGCNTEAMNLHLAEIAARPSRQAPTPSSWSIRPAGTCRHTSSCRPTSPSSPLPPKSPELNPVENVWQFMRDNWLSNRVFAEPRHSARWSVQGFGMGHYSSTRICGPGPLGHWLSSGSRCVGLASSTPRPPLWR